MGVHLNIMLQNLQMHYIVCFKMLPYKLQYIDVYTVKVKLPNPPPHLL